MDTVEILRHGTTDSGAEPSNDRPSGRVKFTAIEPFGVDPSDAIGPGVGEPAGEPGGQLDVDGDGGGSDSGDAGGSNHGDEYVRHADGTVKRNKDGSPRRKRGRKPNGRGPSTSTSKGKISVSGLEAILLSFHGMAAAALKAPELALEKDEAHALAEAAAAVASYYPTTIDPKTLAWINLGTAAVVCYGPRMYMIAARVREERMATAKQQAPAPQSSAQPSNVVPIDPEAKGFKLPPGTTFPGM